MQALLCRALGTFLEALGTIPLPSPALGQQEKAGGRKGGGQATLTKAQPLWPKQSDLGARQPEGTFPDLLPSPPSEP